MSTFDSIDNLLREHAELTEKMGDPAVHADQALARKVGRRFAELEKIVKAHKRWQQLGQDLEDAKELAQEDEDFAAEVPGLEASYEEATETLHRLLIPRDPDDEIGRASCRERVYISGVDGVLKGKRREKDGEREQACRRNWR